MSDDETKSLILSIGRTKRELIDKLEKWNKYVSSIQQDLEYQEWMENAVEQEPDTLAHHTDENFRGLLVATNNTLPGLLNIPEPPDDLGIYISASGTAPPATYYRYMDDMERNFNENNHVVKWAEKNKSSFEELKESHKISSEVRKRVTKLNPRLGKLHQSATDAILRCAAEIIDPPLAAADPRRLLEQFKGHLIDRCRTGKKATYRRIADNLAADSEMTRIAIENEQDTYERLSTEFTHIMKRMKSVNHDYMPQLLKQLEDHIMVVTSAIDPNKIGFSFIDE